MNEVGSSAGYCTLADTHDRFEASNHNDKKTKKDKKREKYKNASIKKDEKTIKVCTSSPYRRRMESRRQSLLINKGNVQGGTANSSCNILVDCGCEEIIMSKEYADKNKISEEKTNLTQKFWTEN